MGDLETDDPQSLASQIIFDQIKNKKDILIIANTTVDGIISSTLLLQSIFDLLGNATVRCIDSNVLHNRDDVLELLSERHHSYIFLDFDTKLFGMIKSLNSNNNFLFINSEATVNEIDFKEEKNKTFFSTFSDDKKVSGKRSIHTTSKLVYSIVNKFDRKITLKSYLLIVAEISKQEVKNHTGVTDLDEDTLSTAKDLNLIQRLKGFAFINKQTNSIVNALENNTTCFIKGITWNRTKSIDVLKKSGVKFVQDNRILNVSELNDKDYDNIVNTLEILLDDLAIENGISENLKKIIKSELHRSLSNNYYLTFEETNSICGGIYSFLRALESCIRNKKFGTALSLALGERSDVMSEINNFMKGEDELIKKTGLKIFSEKWRFYDDKTIVFVNGEGVLDDLTVDLFAILLGKSWSFSDRIICLRSVGVDNEEVYKYIIAKGINCEIDFARFMKKVKELQDNKELNFQGTDPIVYSRQNGIDKLDIIVSMKDLEVFLSKVRGLIMNAKVS